METITKTQLSAGALVALGVSAEADMTALSTAIESMAKEKTELSQKV